MISVVSLAYSTIVAGYYYGESSLKYLLKNTTKTQINLLKTITIVLLMIGSITSPTLLWSIIDILVALLAIINMYALFKLRKEIIIDYKNKI
jgi:AGCS family alanine or glycine:cation symporter